jgi:cell division protein FtsW (lipid II flippase)
MGGRGGPLRRREGRSLAYSTTPVAGSLSREVSTAWSMLTEAVLLVVVIGALLPRFALLAVQEAGRDGRFAEAIITVRGLPDPVLPTLCASLGSYAEPIVRERLCGQTDAIRRSDGIDRIPPALASASVHATKAFLAPLREAQARLADLRRQLREGQDNVLVLDDAIASTEAEIQPFIKRYSIATADGDGPLPLSCAYAHVEAALAEAAARPGTGGEIPRANAVILLGAAFDGHRKVPSLASVAALPSARATSPRACAGFETAAALSATSALMDDARTASMRIEKNQAMMGLLRSAGWQWAAWAVAGLVLLNLSRRAGMASIGVALALVIWAAAAWIGRVPWPFAWGHSPVLARESAYALAMPANFVLWMLGAAIVVLACTRWLRKALASGAQNAASAFAYPGLVFASGIGFLLVLDLSANGQPANRYLALYHQGHLWFGMLTFTVVAFVRQPLGRSLSWTLSLFDGLASNIGKRIGATSGATVFLVLMLALVGAVGSLLPNSPQLTSEIGRLWLIVGAAWFFFMRGTPFTERLARSGNSLASLFRYVWPLLFVVIVLIGAMAVTHDMGPLLIAGYAAGAFVAASGAMWLYQRRGTIGWAYALAVAFFVGWILATTVALFEFGSLDEVAAERLENLAAPLSSANDQLALVTWFQRAAPAGGFGTGAVPWCGFGAGTACAGVPAQIQSDYTFTAMVGAFGWTGAWALTIGCAVWLHVLIRSHGPATRGEPRFVRMGGRIGNDHQAFLSWLCVAWVVLALCQLAVTVAGNLAVIPLTGVTFPFVSFGLTSLVVNMSMLGLAINLNARDEGVNG